MPKFKPIEQLAEDVRVGDLIRLEIKRKYDKTPTGSYCGYIAKKSSQDILLSDVPDSDPVQHALLERAILNLYGDFELTRFCTKDGPSWTCVARKYEIIRRAKK